MQRLVAPFLCLFLALSLVMAGPGAARSVVRGTMLVLCANGVAATVWLDQDGTPVDPAADCRTCPDCLTPATFAAEPPLPLPAFVSRIVPAATLQAAAEVPPPLPVLFPVPRGPPAIAAFRMPAK